MKGERGKRRGEKGTWINGDNGRISKSNLLRAGESVRLGARLTQLAIFLDSPREKFSKLSPTTEGVLDPTDPENISDRD